MKRFCKVIALAVIGTSLLTGCQDQDTIVTDDEVYLARMSASENDVSENDVTSVKPMEAVMLTTMYVEDCPADYVIASPMELEDFSNKYYEICSREGFVSAFPDVSDTFFKDYRILVRAEKASPDVISYTITGTSVNEYGTPCIVATANASEGDAQSTGTWFLFSALAY